MTEQDSSGRPRKRRTLYLQILFVTLAFTLMVVSTGLYVNSMLMQYLELDSKNTLDRTELMLMHEYEDDKPLEEKIRTISYIANNTRLTDGGYGFLMDENAVLLAHPDERIVGRSAADIVSEWEVLINRMDTGDEITSYEMRNYSDDDTVVYAKQLENGWYLAVVTPKNEYYGSLYSLILYLSLLAGILITVTCIILVRIDTARMKTDRAYYRQKLQLELLEKTRYADEQKSTLDNMQKLLNELNALIIVTDPKTNEIIFINDTMRNVFSVDENYSGMICHKVLRQLAKRCEFCPCYKLDENPDEAVIWEQEHAPSGRIFRSFSKYVEWPDGRTVHIQSTMDMTDIRIAEREREQLNADLEIALEEAKAANQAKSDFLAKMSHEIRTPMNAILGITEIHLSDEDLTPGLIKGLEMIYDSGSQLLAIINDILDLSKIEANKMEIIPAKYDLPRMISDTVQAHRLQSENKPVSFVLNVNENTPRTLIGDELRIKQILGNILSNAFKYTDKGKITMTVDSHSGNSSEQAIIVFSVSDTGQGMTEEHLRNLFTEYMRFNVSENHYKPGTGLGLSITKRLVDLMGGKLMVESEVDRGSTFTVHIPQKRADTSICGSEIVNKMQSLHYHSTEVAERNKMLREYMPYGNVLIVDDIRSNIYVTRGMLQPYGLKVDTAASGFEAVDKIAAGNVYDIIFMDHMMPKMNGMETTERLRDMGYKHPIVALTANAVVGQAEVFLQNGFDGFISKPIDSGELNQLLNEFIRDRKSPEEIKAAWLEYHSNMWTGNQ